MTETLHRRALRITLLEDCVFSARNATAGGHRGLDRIPGQTLLGAAAARLYGRFSGRGDDAYTAFHSGRLRFLDGLPSRGDEAAYPVPLAWHRPKSGAEGDPAIYNFARGKGELPGGGQPKQIREGYVFANGDHIEPARSLRLKTAIDPRTGHAAEAQLFGYESIAKGQSFIAWVEADDGLDHLLDEIVAALQGEVLLGRSRSAEYGRVRIEKAGDAAAIDHGTAAGETLTLWLLSDLALADDRGHRTLEPTPQALGFKDGEILWDKTFLRSRRYSPWNAYRHGYDRERLLLTAGGVITLRLKSGPTADQIDGLKAGIGLYREAGLGRLWIEPPLLAQETVALTRVGAPAPADVQPPADPLLAWLEEQGADWRTEMDELAKTLAHCIERVLKAARRRQGIRDDEDFGPSKSQWGRVLETARTKAGRELHSALFTGDDFTGDDAVIKPTGEGWREIINYDKGQPVHLADWLKGTIAVDDTPEAHYAYLIRRLAHRLRGESKRRAAKQGEIAHD